MKRLLLLFFCIHVLAVFGQNGAEIGRKISFKLPLGISQNDYLPDVIIVKFRRGDFCISDKICKFCFKLEKPYS